MLYSRLLHRSQPECYREYRFLYLSRGWHVRQWRDFFPHLSRCSGQLSSIITTINDNRWPLSVLLKVLLDNPQPWYAVFRNNIDGFGSKNDEIDRERLYWWGGKKRFEEFKCHSSNCARINLTVRKTVSRKRIEWEICMIERMERIQMLMFPFGIVGFFQRIWIHTRHTLSKGSWQTLESPQENSSVSKTRSKKKSVTRYAGWVSEKKTVQAMSQSLLWKCASEWERIGW